jgi:phosphoglycolate phosphatase
MAPRAIVFDLDGTVWDSTPWFTRIVQQQGGVTASECIQRLRDGTSIVELMNTCGQSRAGFMRIATQAIPSLPIYSKMRETLLELKERAIPLAVFTSLPGTIAQPLLTASGLENVFGAVRHAGNSPRKPSPSGIYTALSQLQVPHGEGIFYVGDRTIDARTAQNAGISFAWASYGYESSPPAHVTVRIDRPEQLLDL